MIREDISVKIEDCLKEDEVCWPSHGDAAVELVDLLFEELLELRSLGL